LSQHFEVRKNLMKLNINIRSKEGLFNYKTFSKKAISMSSISQLFTQDTWQTLSQTQGVYIFMNN